MEDYVLETFRLMNRTINELHETNIKLMKRVSYLEQQLSEQKSEIQVMKAFEKMNK